MRVAHKGRLRVEAEVVEVCGHIIARFSIAAVAEVGLAGGVVHHEVYIGVLKGGDDVHCLRILLEIDLVYRQGLVVHVSVKGLNVVFALDVLIRPGAGGHGLSGGAVLDDRDGQQIGEEHVRLAERDGKGAVARGARAVIVGEAAAIAGGLLGQRDGIGNIRRGEVSAVVHFDAGIHGEGPVAAAVRRLVVRDDAGAQVILVVQLEDVVIDELAYEEVIGIVGGVGVEAGAGVVVEREDLVCGVRDAELRPGQVALDGGGFFGRGLAAAREHAERQRRGYYG